MTSIHQFIGPNRMNKKERAAAAFTDKVKIVFFTSLSSADKDMHDWELPDCELPEETELRGAASMKGSEDRYWAGYEARQARERERQQMEDAWYESLEKKDYQRRKYRFKER